MNWEIIEENAGLAKIKVIGVGGAGGNAVIHMINHQIQGADFICANTDSQALDRATGSTILKLGDNVTRGLGAGADPQVGRAAAERDRAAIEELLAGADMIFITAGMGGGTGTGAAPVIAEIAKENNLEINLLVKRAKSISQKILHNYKDFNLMTIDKFTNRVIRSFSKELGISNSYNIILEENEFIEELMIKDFYPLYRGYYLNDMPLLSEMVIKEIGIMLSDKQTGPFELEIDWIRAN